MNVWYKTGTSWMMLSMQIFEIPALPPAIRVDSTTLQAYTGTYRMACNNTAVVTLKSDTLFFKKNKHASVALLPETDNIFFTTADARGRKLFTKNENGVMLLLERRNGQDVVWKRD